MIKKEKVVTNKEPKHSKVLVGSMVLIFALFSFSVYKIITVLNDYSASDEEYGNLKNNTVKQEWISYSDDENVKELLEVDYTELKKRNSDYCGWLEIPNSDYISYPLMQAADNEYYLHRTFEKKNLFAGAIFMDYRNSNDFNDNVTFIYGHSMKNKSMFGTLKYYQNYSYYKEHQYVYVYLEKETRVYKVFSFLETEVDSKVYAFSKLNQKETADYCRLLKENSIYDTGTEANGDMPILCLSTCNGSGNRRWVLCAVLEEILLRGE